MFTKGKKKGTIVFAVQPQAPAAKVLVVGSFNQWKPVAMVKQKTGGFSVTVPAPAGTHEYRFIVDGQWVSDPDNGCYVRNPYGTANSVAKVE